MLSHACVCFAVYYSLRFTMGNTLRPFETVLSRALIGQTSNRNRFRFFMREDRQQPMEPRLKK